MPNPILAVCSDPLFNASLSWNTPHPSFGNCLCRSSIAVPSLCLLASCIPYAAYLASLRRTAIRWTRLLRLKAAIGLLLVLVALLDLLKAALEMWSSGTSDPIDFISPSALAVAMALCLALHVMEQSRSLPASALLFVFYCASFLASAPALYAAVNGLSHSRSPLDMYSFLTLLAYVVLLLAQLVCTCTYDRGLRDGAAADEKVFREFRSSILSRLTFSWLDGPVLAAFRKDVSETDAEQLDDCLRVKAAQKDLDKALAGASERRRTVQDVSPSSQQVQYDTQQLVQDEAADDEGPGSWSSRGRSVRLWFALWKAFGGQLLLSWAIVLIHSLVVFGNPFLLNSLIVFASSSEPLWHGWVYSFLLFLVAIVSSVSFHASSQLALNCEIRIRSALIAAVCRKSLTVSPECRANSAFGELVNLVTVDANKIADAVTFLWSFVACPVQIVVALILLWQQLGAAVLAGVAVFVVLIPVNSVMMRYIRQSEAKEMATKDERQKLLDEVLNAIRFVKLHAWESPFMTRIAKVRQKELRYLAQVSYLFLVIVIFWVLNPFVVMLVSFAAYVYSGQDQVLTASKAFVSVSLFAILRFPMTVLPRTVAETVNAHVSLRRIEKFLEEEDIDETNVLRLAASDATEMVVEIEDASFSWKRDAHESLLQNVNLCVKRGKLVAVVGRVGCGKSSLLLSILGETVKRSGSVVVRGSVAYVPQEAWIQNLSVRDNIVFGQALDQRRYAQVLRACELRKDLRRLPSGDATVIGDRGVVLSGGQRQRVSLARAAYQSCDLYLLDDPLAAVDSHVGKRLFQEVIGNSGMLAGKTRVLVTHSLHWLPNVDEIVFMDENGVSEIGTYDVLLNQDGAFAKFCSDAFNEDSEGQSSELSEAHADTKEVDEIKAAMDSTQPNAASDRPLLAASDMSEDSTQLTQVAPGSPAGDEFVESGRVSHKAYAFYISARGGALFSCLLLLYTVYTATNVYSSIWLTKWTSDPNLTNASVHESANSSESLRDLNNYYLGVYGAVGGVIVLIVALYATLSTYSALRASRVIHSTLLTRIFQAPISFFDTTPIGRIVNRFSKDLEIVDRDLPMVVFDCIDCIMRTLSCVVVIAYTTPVFLAAAVPLAVIYAAVQVLYVPVSRQSRRLDSKTRSPILTNFSESISGATVIRAFGQQHRFVQIAHDSVDNNSRFFFLKLASNRWLGFRLELLGNVAVVIAALLATFSRDSLTPALVGLSISYALQVSEALNWTVRQVTELETDSVALERLREYSNLEKEAPWTTATQPPEDWPAEGRVRFCNYATRYRPGLDLVLKDVNVTLEPGELVGVVGRTGAGKSSLALALFRLLEASFGHIEVDGVRTDRLGLHALRSALTILPQEPAVFSGSLRHNLDPLERSSDQEVWAALEAAQLSAWAAAQPAGLLSDCGDAGRRLSAGQRQLLCLARALLRPSRLLLLDEATASVDLQTDALIMAAVRRRFSSSTVVVIAHRLATVLDADRVLVLDEGRVREFDRPQRLLAQEASLFRLLASEAKLLPPGLRAGAHSGAHDA